MVTSDVQKNNESFLIELTISENEIRWNHPSELQISITQTYLFYIVYIDEIFQRTYVGFDFVYIA